MTVEGGHKPHRMLCFAKLIELVSVCTRHPQLDSSQPAQSAPGPESNLEAKKQSLTTVKEANGEQFYVVETILDIKIEGEKKIFKVKWSGFRHTHKGIVI